MTLLLLKRDYTKALHSTVFGVPHFKSKVIQFNNELHLILWNELHLILWNNLIVSDSGTLAKW